MHFAVAQVAGQLDTAQDDVVAHAASLGLAHGRFLGIGLPVVGHPGGAHGQEIGRFPFGLHPLDLGAQGVVGPAGFLVVDDHPFLGQQFLGQVEGGARDAQRHRGHRRAGVVEGLHDPAEAFLLVLDFFRAQQVFLGHADVGEGDGGRVGGADAHLLFQTHQFHARQILGHDERLDAGLALAGIDIGPHHHMAGATTGGDVDLLAVDDVVVTVLPGGGLDVAGVRPRARFGDGHGGPALAEFFLLLRRAGGHDGGIAEALTRNGQREPRVAPAHFGHGGDGDHVAAVLDAGLGFLVLAATAEAAHAAATAAEHGLQRVEFLRGRVLGLVVLAGDGAKHRLGEAVGHLLHVRDVRRKFEINHCIILKNRAGRIRC